MNGTLVPADQARVPVTDHGLTTGDGVFEALKVTGGVPFALTRHLARLCASARGLGLPEPDLDQIRAAAPRRATGRTSPPALGRQGFLSSTSPSRPSGSRKKMLSAPPKSFTVPSLAPLWMSRSRITSKASREAAASPT